MRPLVVGTVAVIVLGTALRYADRLGPGAKVTVSLIRRFLSPGVAGIPDKSK